MQPFHGQGSYSDHSDAPESNAAESGLIEFGSRVGKLMHRGKDELPG